MGESFVMENNKPELFSALAKAQAQIKGAVKDSTNPFFNSKYADLASCFDAIREPFAENELSILQLPQTTQSGMVIVTMIAHSSGETICDGGVPVKPLKDDPPSMGSAMTYARRYGLTAMTGLPQIDDDGNAASQPAKYREMPEKQAKEISKLLDAADLNTGEGGRSVRGGLVRAYPGRAKSIRPLG